MSLKGQFKTEAALVRDGTWFDVTTNSDGSKCRVKLRRSGRGNPLWGIAFREQTKDVDTDALTPQEDAVIMGRTMAEAAVVDWEHMQPEDDGAELDFSVENAAKLLTDPDWLDLLTDWQAKAADIKGFQAKREAEAGK
jgi:hypothetical protein